MRIDVNSDLGEHYGAWSMGEDEVMLDIVSSANVACGFHAGDPVSIRRTLAGAAERGVIVGAHVAYPDLVGFGRRPMNLSDAELEADVIYQIGALEGIARVTGTTVEYVKPHGALYNTIAHDERQAAAVIRAMLDVNPALRLMALAGSPIVEQAKREGLTVVTEAFADRAYEPDGQLVSRREAGSVLHDPSEIADRMLRLVEERVIEARDGTLIPIEADSICVHGDSPGAVAMAQNVRDRLTAAGVDVRSFVDLDEVGRVE